MTALAFSKKVKETFSYNEPIFTEELLNLFPNKSRAQVFRYVESAKENKELIKSNLGIYYLAEQNNFGLPSVLLADEIIEKKYIKYKDEVYGVYSGIKLLNMFGVTTQMAGVITVVSSKESSKKRTITMNNRKFILKRSRCEITKENYACYTIFELFNCIGKDEKISKEVKERIIYFIKAKKIKIFDITEMAGNFPSKAVKNFMRSGIIYEII